MRAMCLWKILYCTYCPALDLKCTSATVPSSCLLACVYKGDKGVMEATALG